MINSRFIRLYQSLSKAELRQLKKWVASSSHNQHEDVLKLFEFLDSRQKISKVTVQKKRAFQFIFPSITYNEYKLNIVMTYALNVLKDFIGYNQVLLKGFYLKKELIRSLRERGMTHLAALEQQKIEKKLEKSTLENAEMMLYAYELAVEEYEMLGAERKTVETNLPNLFGHLTDFYCIAMLKYACEAISHSNITKQVYEIPLLEEVLKQAKGRKQGIVQLYYNAYQTLAAPQEIDYFKATEALFLKEHQKLNAHEQRDVLLILINYSIKRLNTDAKAFRRKAFDWYKWGIVQKILFEDKSLSRFAYSNIVSLGLKLGEFEWVAPFIREYAAFLPEQYRSNYIHYNTAKLHFYQKNYAKAQGLLTRIEYDNIFLNLDSKTMLLEIYYEQESWDALDALLGSFNRYLQRKSVIAYHKKVYQNIINLTRKLVELNPYDKKAVQGLQSEITTTNPLVEREWLLLQIAKFL